MKASRRKKPVFPGKSLILRIVKSALFGCVITIIVILLFALLLKWELFGESSMPIATSLIKAVCAAFVGLLCANGLAQRAWLWAGIGGATYILFAFLAFSLVERTFAISLAFLADIALGFISGVAGGMLLQLKKTS